MGFCNGSSRIALLAWALVSVAGCLARGGVSSVVVKKVAVQQADGSVQLVWPRPEPVTMTTANATPDSVTLQWAADSKASSYTVIRAGTPAGPWLLRAIVAAPALTFTDTAVKSGAVYYYAVRAGNRGNKGSFGALARISLPAALPGVEAPAVAKVARRLPLLGSMALLPGGCFTMGITREWGSHDVRPAHTVCLRQFLIDLFEVTNLQYARCVDAGVCSAPKSEESAPPGGRLRQAGSAGLPVVNVSWSQAHTYCAWTAKRLPTEAEWEYAALGGMSASDYVSLPRPDCLSANLGLNGATCKAGPMPVGRYPPNDYGLYDTLGNVWEWVYDWYSSRYYARSPVTSPVGPGSGRRHVRRGGSWSNLFADDPVQNRAILARESSSRTGFRCAR